MLNPFCIDLLYNTEEESDFLFKIACEIWEEISAPQKKSDP